MKVSTLKGDVQASWLRAATWTIGALAAAGLVLPGEPGDFSAGLAIVVLISTPLLRVVWIVYRLAREHDRRFVLVGVGLLSAVTLGVLVSAFVKG